MTHPTARSTFERAFGYIFAAVGVAVLASIVVYGVMHPAGLRQAAFMFTAGFFVFVGLVCLALALYLASSSAAAQRLGCVAAIVFGSPLLLVIVFLVWSLFQTTGRVR